MDDLGHVGRCNEKQGRSFDCESRRPFVVCRGPHFEVPAVSAEDSMVADIMTSQVLCVDEALDTVALAELLHREGVRSAPVINAGRHPIGMISSADLPTPLRTEVAVAEIMTSPAVYISARASVMEAAALMALEEVNQLPVVSDDDKVVGLLTSLDVVRWVARRVGYLRHEGARP